MILLLLLSCLLCNMKSFWTSCTVISFVPLGSFSVSSLMCSYSMHCCKEQIAKYSKIMRSSTYFSVCFFPSVCLRVFLIWYKIGFRKRKRARKREKHTIVCSGLKTKLRCEILYGGIIIIIILRLLINKYRFVLFVFHLVVRFSFHSVWVCACGSRRDFVLWTTVCFHVDFCFKTFMHMTLSLSFSVARLFLQTILL